ncbi:MAG: hypothetical protein ACR2GI_00705 [Thermomicrobiales bacterium]
MTIPQSTIRRVQAMELRIRIERVAIDAWRRVCPAVDPSESGQIGARLTFLLVGLDGVRFSNAYRAIRLGRHVYGRTSDVLHGRVNMVNVSKVEIDAWREAVERLEEIANTVNAPVTIW